MDSKDQPSNTTEAIRRAVEALGYHASVDQILDYVRAHAEPPAPARRAAGADAEASATPPRRGKK